MLQDLLKIILPFFRSIHFIIQFSEEVSIPFRPVQLIKIYIICLEPFQAVIEGFC